ncbi:hypothetical protein MHYP_G00322690 [Metynnis hypsauchen]
MSPHQSSKAVCSQGGPTLNEQTAQQRKDWANVVKTNYGHRVHSPKRMVRTPMDPHRAGSRGGAGAYPSRHRAKGRTHPGQLKLAVHFSV